MYAVQQDMVTRFGLAEMVQLTNLDTTGATTVNATTMDAALQDASNTIDGYLQGRYQLPLAKVPQILTIYCCNIARAFLYKARITEEVKDRRDEALAYLKSIAKGDIGLSLDSDDEPLQPSDDLIQVQSEGNVFSRDRGRGF